MGNTSPCVHALDIAWWDGFDIPQTVFVCQLALENIANDFHIPMAVLTKAGARINPVLIDHTQIAPPHKFGVVVNGEREGVKAF